MLPHTAQGEAARALERAREHLALRLALDGVAPFTSASAWSSQAFGQTLDELLVEADVAVSLAKDLGRNRVVVASEQVIDPLVDEDGPGCGRRTSADRRLADDGSGRWRPGPGRPHRGRPRPRQPVPCLVGAAGSVRGHEQRRSPA